MTKINTSREVLPVVPICQNSRESVSPSISARNSLTVEHRHYDDPLPTEYYRQFAIRAGCLSENATSVPKDGSAIKCLREVDTLVLQNASAYTSYAAKNGQWAFIPVTDRPGFIVSASPTDQLLRGKVNGERILVGVSSTLEPPTPLPSNLFPRATPTKAPTLSPKTSPPKRTFSPSSSSTTRLSSTPNSKLCNPPTPFPRFLTLFPPPSTPPTQPTQPSPATTPTASTPRTQPTCPPTPTAGNKPPTTSTPKPPLSVQHTGSLQPIKSSTGRSKATMTTTQSGMTAKRPGHGGTSILYPMLFTQLTWHR